MGLLDFNLVVLDDIDKFISTLIKKQAASSKLATTDHNIAINIGISIIRSFVLGRKFSLSDFKSIHQALKIKLGENQAIQQLFHELDSIKPQSHGHYHYRGSSMINNHNHNHNQLSSSSSSSTSRHPSHSIQQKQNVLIIKQSG